VSYHTLDYKQVMTLTGLKKSHIYMSFHDKELPGYKGGSRKGIRFYAAGVKAFMERRANAPVPKPAAPPPKRRSRRPPDSPPNGFRYL
jgi:excisionase family DNA binding protein